MALYLITSSPTADSLSSPEFCDSTIWGVAATKKEVESLMLTAASGIPLEKEKVFVWKLVEGLTVKQSEIEVVGLDAIEEDGRRRRR